MKKKRKKNKKVVIGLFIRRDEIKKIAKICKANPDDIYGWIRFLRKAVGYLREHKQYKRKKRA